MNEIEQSSAHHISVYCTNNIQIQSHGSLLIPDIKFTYKHMSMSRVVAGLNFVAFSGLHTGWFVLL